MRERTLRPARTAVVALAALVAGCARAPGTGGPAPAPALGGAARDAILSELLPGALDDVDDAPLLEVRIEPFGERALAALATSRMEYELAEPGAAGTLFLLEPDASGAPDGSGWSVVDERGLGIVRQESPQGLVLALDPAAVALSPDESAVAASFGVRSDGEESRVTTALFRVEAAGLRELLRWEDVDSGSGSPHERIEHTLSARPAPGRTLPDLLLETRSERCEERDGEWRCDETHTTRVHRWTGQGYVAASDGG